MRLQIMNKEAKITWTFFYKEVLITALVSVVKIMIINAEDNYTHSS